MSQGRGHDITRLQFLDALRCLAACYVLSFHMMLLPVPQLSLPAWLFEFVLAGGSGVTLFFLVSAFALCYSADYHQRHKASVYEFYIRRFLRIAPLFYCMLIFYTLLNLAITNNAFATGDLVINASFIFNSIPEHIESYVWAGWTIGVEMIFYIIFPLLYRYATNISKAASCLMIAIILSWTWNYLLENYAVEYGYISSEEITKVARFSFLTHLPAFMTGILVYHIFNCLHSHLNNQQLKKTGALFLLIFCILTTALTSGHISGNWGAQNWQALYYGFLILALGLFQVSWIVNNISCRLGKISYSLYLLHPPLIHLLAPLYQQLYTLIPYNSLAFLICLGLSLTLLIPISMLSYRLIERPGITMAKALIQRISTRNLLSPTSRASRIVR